MSNLTLPISVTLGILAVAIFLMVWGWRRRSRRDGAIALNHVVPALTVITSAPVLYVATTKPGEPLERVALSGLGFRGRATVTVAEQGVALELIGETPVFIARDLVLGALPSTWTIDRVVEKDGLIALSWTTPGTEPVTVDSYLRVIDGADHASILAAIGSITRTPAHISAASESHGSTGTAAPSVTVTESEI